MNDELLSLQEFETRPKRKSRRCPRLLVLENRLKKTVEKCPKLPEQLNVAGGPHGLRGGSEHRPAKVTKKERKVTDKHKTVKQMGQNASHKLQNEKIFEMRIKFRLKT